MSFDNPTPIKVGMSGTFNGRRYRVAGRIVMGMEADGERYFWNEFNLIGPENQSATLVYEEGEQGGEWRMFTLFEPDYPMTAADAATRRVGDQLNLDGADARVTLVDESRVYHIEGEAPEGVESGDVAYYFNAEAGRNMVVVSWTGDEVEYYRGINLTSGLVAAAFNLRREQVEASSAASGGANLFSLGGNNPAQFLPQRGFRVALAILAVVLGLAGYSSCRTVRQRAPMAKQPAPAAPLKLQAAGRLDGRDWRVQSHAVVEIAEVGRIFDRHEYELADAETNRALLVCGWQPGAKEWVLFTPWTPTMPSNAEQAAALRVGERVSVDGWSAIVTELFQSVASHSEGAASGGLISGAVQFGFLARSNSTVLLARWNAGGIHYLRGKTFPAREVEAAFNGRPSR